MIIQVAVNIPSEKTFTYVVPPDLEKLVANGKRVLVPFGKKRVPGYVVSSDKSAAPAFVGEPGRADLREICSVLDEEPLFNAEDLQFYEWVSAYYLYPLGKLLKDVLPGGIDASSQTWVSLCGAADGEALSALGKAILEILRENPQGISLKKLKAAMSGKRIDSHIRRLQSAGAICLEERMQRPSVSPRRTRFVAATEAPACDLNLGDVQRRCLDLLALRGEVPASVLNEEFKNAGALIAGLRKKGLIRVEEKELFRGPGQQALEHPFGNSGAGAAFVLNEDQRAAAEALMQGIASGAFATYLLHGVTGSGKTEVYLRAMEKTVNAGGSVIFLIPEIALTPLLLGRIGERFGEGRIAVMHSGISRAARYDQWRKIGRGETSIIIGARSAIFAPARRLRLIIVDEEHDPSYKQDERMPYNARDMAVLRGRQNSAVVVLGSATPGVQTYYHALNGKYGHLQLPRRIEDRPMPKVEIVDMKQEINAEGKSMLISRPLSAALQNVLERGKQAILFLNRRGFHTFVCCYGCGYVFKCRNCSVSLTHHAKEGVLKCHYCDFSIKALPLCPVCKDGRIGTFGMGTEKLEEQITARFPGARLQRMDSDVMTGKGIYEQVLRRFDRREIDILIGTQMVTKGHDFPHVLVVGVISADTSLNIPDFRASERAFQVLTQVSGRGGRGEEPGRVFIQTFNPDHFAIRLAAGHDYRGFYDAEIALRKEFSYPPFSRIASIWITGNVQDKVQSCAAQLGEIARSLAKGKPLEVMGPAEAPISRVKGRYRWHLLLKGGTIRELHFLAREIVQRTPRALAVKVDIDPLNFM